MSYFSSDGADNFTSTEQEKTFLTARENNVSFLSRHIGSTASQITQMLTEIHCESLDALMEQTIPQSIRLAKPLQGLKTPITEQEMLAELAEIAAKNTPKRSLIGQGYYATQTPYPILRNVLENPAWYTAYTPYQAEIAQGRLEALFHFQHMICELTGMDIANASLLDEATAAAEAMSLAYRVTKSDSHAFFVAKDVHPQTIDVLNTRAHFMGIELIVDTPDNLAKHSVFAALLQYPSTTGEVRDLSDLIAQGQNNGALMIVATDLLALTLLTPPKEMGADIAIGSTQRFGVPVGFGGPHAAFFACHDKLKRHIPGRIIGLSKDKYGKPAYRMALQTREQHIRRERATSNLCTAQTLLANMAVFYAIYHGADGLMRIAQRIHSLTVFAANLLQESGFTLKHSHFFDTLCLETNEQTDLLYQQAQQAGFNLRKLPNQLCISFDELSHIEEVQQLVCALQPNLTLVKERFQKDTIYSATPDSLQRTTPFLQQAVFNQYHSESQLVRYLKRLENKDYSLVHGMIPLGSCTMKLNATAEMLPISWQAFNAIHPFAPTEQTLGYQEFVTQLKTMLANITGLPAVSLQPNSGAQGEYAGLLAILRYQQARGESQRHLCFIPQSAHGTNPASAVMSGLTVVTIACDPDGNISLDDLKAKIEQHHQQLCAMMITYPSTHGVFEENIRQVCELIHNAGGQVYLDGANMNAQLGLTSPAMIGADVVHLNLHKTFCIPHGGGGPGVGPICAQAHLTNFLPSHLQFNAKQKKSLNFAVCASPYGSASILPISWAFIRMMGAQGLTLASQVAILHANYAKERLKTHYSILYQGRAARVAHECIIDIRPLTQQTGVTEEDIAKRLMDYGFHAPTMSFPVKGTLMIEPTESEDKAEIDRFCDAMIAIRQEITHIEQGIWSKQDNPLVNAPHTQADLLEENWAFPYSKTIACFPINALKEHKFWPTVNRIDNVYGDRHLICRCQN